MGIELGAVGGLIISQRIICKSSRWSVINIPSERLAHIPLRIAVVQTFLVRFI